MDHRCPVCGKDIDRKKFSRAIVSTMAIDCPHCLRKIHLNIHRAEAVLVLGNFIFIVGFATFAWWLQSRGLVLAMFGAIMAGALLLPLLERAWLRDWPRYALPADAAAEERSKDGKV